MRNPPQNFYDRAEAGNKDQGSDAGRTKVVCANHQVDIISGVVARFSHGVVNGHGLVFVATRYPSYIHHYECHHRQRKSPTSQG